MSHSYPFMLSYARRNATTGQPPQPDPHFTAFVQRLNKRVDDLTGSPGFVDRTDLQPGQEWPDELAEALRTAHALVCLYSPAYFQSEYCGKEMQVFLERRRKYIEVNGGKKPANIIPVVWQPVPYRIPKTLPDIEYTNPSLDPDRKGVWDLGDQGQDRELINIADQIAIRVREAGDLTPLPAPDQRPQMVAVRSAFLPPQLPLLDFDSPNAKAGPDAVTFVYPSSTRWNTWPWAPPDEQAMLYLAAAAAKGREMESTQLAFDLADADLLARLQALRQRNNVAVLFVDAANLDVEGLRTRIRDYDREEHSSFATIIVVNGRCPPELRAKIEQVFPYFARRPKPHFRIVDTPGTFNAEMRESFSEAIGEALAQLRIVVVNNPHLPNVAANANRNLPSVGGAL
jgi:hypothetical protein